MRRQFADHHISHLATNVQEDLYSIKCFLVHDLGLDIKLLDISIKSKIRINESDGSFPHKFRWGDLKWVFQSQQWSITRTKNQQSYSYLLHFLNYWSHLFTGDGWLVGITPLPSGVLFMDGTLILATSRPEMVAKSETLTKCTDRLDVSCITRNVASYMYIYMSMLKIPTPS